MKNKLYFIFSIAVIMAMVFYSCDHKKGLLLPSPAPVSTNSNPCDTIKFGKDIVPILSGTCYNMGGCHGVGSPYGDYTTYSGIHAKVLNNSLENRVILHTPTSMPAAGPLPQAQQNIIQCWINNGAPNN
jgi:hypothetical protein